MDCIYELRDVTTVDHDGMYFALRIFKSVEEAVAWVESVPEDETLSFHDCEDSDELFELVELPFGKDISCGLKTVATFSRILAYAEGEDEDYYYWQLSVELNLKPKAGV